MKITTNALSIGALLSIATLLSGCMDKPTQIPFLNRVMTADEFTAQSDVREKVLIFCANDLGRFGSDANCVNAKQSSRMNSAGSGNFPSIKYGAKHDKP